MKAEATDDMGVRVRHLPDGMLDLMGFVATPLPLPEPPAAPQPEGLEDDDYVERCGNWLAADLAALMEEHGANDDAAQELIEAAEDASCVFRVHIMSFLRLLPLLTFLTAPPLSPHLPL